jgi:hypothetical protein
MSPELDEREQERLAEMRAALSARLRGVCDGMDPSEFDALVTQIAKFKIRWGESLMYDNPPALGGWMFGRESGDNKK